jgi:hypothetical protein
MASVVPFSRDERWYDFKYWPVDFSDQLAGSTYFVVWSRQLLWPQLQTISAVVASPSQ